MDWTVSFKKCERDRRKVEKIFRLASVTIYICLAIEIPVLGILLKEFFNKRNVNMIVIGIFSIVMILIAGLRGINVGTDTIHYKWIFHDSINLPFSQIFDYYIEFGYVFLNKLIYFLFGEFQFLLIVNAIIIIWGISYFISKTSDNVVLSLFLFVTIGYFCSSMNTMRQFMALTFVLVSYYYFAWKKRKKTSYILILIASTLHTSAFLILAVYLGYLILTGPSFRRSSFVKFSMFLVAVLFVFSLDRIMNYLIQIGAVSSMEKLTTSAGITTSIFSFSLLIKFFMSVLYMYLKKIGKIDKSKDDSLFFLNYLNILSCFVSIGAGLFPLVSRLNIYFALTSIVFIPNVLELTSRNNKFVLKTVVYIAFFASFVLSQEGNSAVPWVLFQ